MLSKIKVILILVAVLTTGLFAQCESIEAKVNSLNKEFNSIREQMSDPAITKEKYDELHKKYNTKWKELQAKRVELKKCEERANQKYKALYNEGVSLKKAGKLQEAYNKFNESLLDKPDYDKSIYQIADVSIDLKKFNDVAKYTEMVDDNEKKGILYFQWARALVKSKQYNSAIDIYNKAAKLNNPAKSNTDAASAYLKIGLIYQNYKSDNGSALAYYKKSSNIDSRNSTVWELLGALTMELKPTKQKPRDEIAKEAGRYFEKGVALGKRNKNYSMLCARLAQAYNLQGKAKSAHDIAKQSLAAGNGRNQGLAYLELGKALMKMKKYDDARNALEKAKNDLATKKSAEYELTNLDKILNG